MGAVCFLFMQRIARSGSASCVITWSTVAIHSAGSNRWCRLHTAEALTGCTVERITTYLLRGTAGQKTDMKEEINAHEIAAGQSDGKTQSGRNMR
jgi:hypothetical protein